MKTVQAYIDSKQSELLNHEFFEILKNLDSIEEISSFVPELTFWAMTFQDILRINEEKVIDPFYKKVARHHRLEDAGHEKWFLSDKQYMSKYHADKDYGRDDVAWLYSKDSELVRDAAYALMSEIYKIDNEVLNIVLLLTLESSGHVFFKEVSDQVKKTGEDKNLQYFSSSHLEVELAHAMFEEEMERKIYEKRLDISTRREALQLVDRCYVAFSKMFDGLVLACNRRIEEAKVRDENVTQSNTTVEYTQDQ